MNRLRTMTNPESVRLPQPPPAPVTPTGFMACPACVPGLTDAQRWLYQMAFEQAQAVVRPSLPERDLAGVWN
jgi:hypothetical protein